MEDKLAIILSGGGMKGGWGAGVLLGLADKFKIREPEILVGCSASAGTGLYYVAGQYDNISNAWTSFFSKKKMTESFISWGWKGPSSAKEIFELFKSGKWKDYLPEKETFNFFNSSEWRSYYSRREIVNLFRFWKIIDIDYLVDEVFKKHKPTLNLDEVYSSRTDFLIPALNTKTGKMRYFSNKDKHFYAQNREGIIDAVKASMKVPLASGFSPKDVLKAFIPWGSSSIAEGLRSEVRVKNGTYCDSILTSSAQTHLRKVVRKGAKKILIIDLDPQNKYFDGEKVVIKKRLFDRERAVFNRWLNHQGDVFRDNYSHCEKRVENYVCPENIKIHTLELPRNLIGTLDNNEDLLRRSFDNGYQLSENDKYLENFLG